MCDGRAGRLASGSCRSGGQGVAAVGERVDQAVGDEAVQGAFALGAGRARPGRGRVCPPGPAAPRRTSSSSPRTWRSVPAKPWVRRGGARVGGRAGGAPGAAVGDRALRRSAGRAAMHTSAPSSIRATLNRAARAGVAGQQRPRRRRGRALVEGGPGRPGPSTARATTRRTLVSTTGVPLAEGERRHRPRGVGADAGQAQQRVDVVGHDPAEAPGDLTRALVQAQRAARVAELAPHPHRVTRRVPRRASAGVGHRSSHARVGRQHPGDRGLLQHDLADQHGPRRSRPGRATAGRAPRGRTRPAPAGPGRRRAPACGSWHVRHARRTPRRVGPCARRSRRPERSR